MLRWRAVGFATAFAIAMGANANAGGPYGTVQVGGWKGGAYTDDTTGQFSACTAGVPYKSGIYFVVTVTANGGWGLGFADPNWQLTPGTNNPVDLTFDNRQQFHVFAHSVDEHMALVPMPLNSALIAAFRNARQMQAFAQGQVFGFNLNDTSRLLPALVECVARAKTGLQNVGAIAPHPPLPQVRSALSSAPPAETSTQPQGSPALEIEAIQLATNFILHASLHNPHVLGPSETPVQFASFGAAWKADEATGMVKIVPPSEGLKGLDVAAAVAAADSKECGGKFASGRVSELVDSDVVFRGFSSCEDSNGARSAQYFIVPRAAGGFVIFSFTTTGAMNQPSNSTQGQQLTTLRKAALVSVEHE